MLSQVVMKTVKYISQCKIDTKLLPFLKYESNVQNKMYKYL